MSNNLEKLLLYEEYEKYIEIYDDDNKFNEYMDELNSIIDKYDKIYENHKDNDKYIENINYNEKRIVPYKKNYYTDIYVYYIMFICVIYQLIVGEEKVQQYFGKNSNRF